MKDLLVNLGGNWRHQKAIVAAIHQGILCFVVFCVFFIQYVVHIIVYQKKP